ncbi:HET-domain-containing protein [Bimuria novae-zelandiae CBS 107.79]|uniref:HET-domain-containing protein n=1 Tax=Bimuria novae-zelandiae CBS 107.79 TaxID=1447943 RepID=A0A6A5V7I6_9PLEO|nr:HET-domain-containing protein [Bimuria novae-zelandiae CBS 107.79]
MEDPYATARLDLGNREFRLLQLQSSSDRGKITCILRSYPLNDCPPYIALSYSWGPTQSYREIDLNNARFPVGRNLWWFLLHMRLQERHGYYWIDALCINQSDVAEQNHQVQMMGSIYSKAQSVAIWLGEVDSSSNVAMQFIAERKPLDSGSISFGKIWTLEQAESVLRLCQRNYWRRIWIVQEVMLAKNATIFCGSMLVSWSKFEGLIDDLRRIFDMGLAHTRSAYLRCACEVLASPAIVIAKAISTRSERKQSLLTLLEVYRDHEATDIRDKVYALHGLAEDSQDLPIDYGTSPRDLLTALLRHAKCRASQSEKGRKELLRLGRMMAETLGVDCSDDEIESHLHYTSSSFSTDPVSSVTLEGFSASAPNSFCADLQTSDEGLEVRGEENQTHIMELVRRSKARGNSSRKYRKKLNKRLSDQDRRRTLSVASDSMLHPRRVQQEPSRSNPP